MLDVACFFGEELWQGVDCMQQPPIKLLTINAIQTGMLTIWPKVCLAILTEIQLLSKDCPHCIIILV